ncbi:hypothetical protein HMPREF0866_02513 [Ruminococcaceae bacterium D16]|nr:hypothetical protein HMPREF0866_02513 [Ruminococcaceae bacterium D16]
MLMLLAALQSEYGVPDPHQLEGLMAGLAAGDRESLAQLYHRTRAAVYGLALSILGSGHDAEDVTQDTYVTAWEKCHLYRPQGTPMAWLLTITRNLARMKLRDRGRTQDLGEEQWHAIPAQSPSVTPEDRAVLEAALNILSDQERQIVVLHAAAGLKHREIAKLLELPLPTVLSKYRRALSKLKTKLEGDDAP